MVFIYHLVANSSHSIPLSLGSTSKSSVEQGLSSLPSLEMVRNDVGDTDWERLLSLLPLSAPPGVCVSMLRVLLLLCTRGGGARWPSGISCGCYKIFFVCVYLSLILKFTQKCTQCHPSPVVPEDSSQKGPDKAQWESLCVAPSGTLTPGLTWLPHWTLSSKDVVFPGPGMRQVGDQFLLNDELHWTAYHVLNITFKIRNSHGRRGEISV